MSAVIGVMEVFVPLDDLLDYQAEFDRLTKEKTKLLEEVTRVKGKLANEGFVKKAPEKVILEEKEKQLRYEDMLAKICSRLDMVSKKL